MNLTAGWAMSTDPKTLMSSKSQRKSRFGFRRFRRSESGTAAIEFSIVAIPFFLMIAGIMEVGLNYIANRFMSHSVDVASRMIRTGEVRSATHTEQQFKQLVCGMPTMAIFDCNRLTVDVKTVATFDHEAIPKDQNGDLDGSQMGFAPGGRMSINIVRAYYEWPTFINWANSGIDEWSRGRRLIIATSAFVTEPY